MKLTELLALCVVDNPVTLEFYDPDSHKRTEFFSGFAMDIIGTENYSDRVEDYSDRVVDDPENYEVVEIFSRLLEKDDIRYDDDCYTDEIVISIVRKEKRDD